MVDDRERRRVLCVFETHWDRAQLAACRHAWQDRIDVVYPPPDDVECPSELDPLAFVEAAVGGAFGRVDGVMSSSDYPGATLAAAIATRLGLPGARPERVIRASHKYYSRLAQREAVPEAVPEFALLDPRRPEPPASLGYPCFVKPVKGAYSVLARRIEDAAALRGFLASPAVRDFTDDYLAIFNRMVHGLTDLEFDGRYFLAEGLLRGRLVTVEGFARGAEIQVFGIVDSVLHQSGSFARFDYPSTLPRGVQERMADIAKRVVRALGLDHTLFNIEMVHDPDGDGIGIIEINPRLCGQFADLYQKVDGTNTYELALALCTGAPPVREPGQGTYAVASSVPLRVHAPMRVTHAPGPADVAVAEALYPGTRVWSECAKGEELADFDIDEDGASHRYGVINLGAPDRAELEARLARIVAQLDYRMEPLDASRRLGDAG